MTAKPFDYAPLLLCSAKTGAELGRLFKTIERVQKETGKDSLYIILSGGMVGRDRLVEAITQHTQPK